MINGNVQPISLSLWSYPSQGGNGQITNLNEDLRILLDVNFSNFGSCKTHIHNNEIFAYCARYNSEDALLNLTNNLTADIETYQDIMLNWDMNGTIQSFWIPNVNSTTDSWSGNRVREDYSANYFYSSQFVNDSIYLNVGGTSSDHLTFTNGSVKCQT